VRFIVFRHSPAMPREQWSPTLEGWWIDAPDPDRISDPRPPAGTLPAYAVAEPTGRYETRDDGEMAEVWMIRPTAIHGQQDQVDIELRQEEHRRHTHQSMGPQAPTAPGGLPGDEWVTSEGVRWLWTVDGWVRAAI
jgi:hypothetical protein